MSAGRVGKGVAAKWKRPVTRSKIIEFSSPEVEEAGHAIKKHRIL